MSTLTGMPAPRVPRTIPGTVGRRRPAPGRTRWTWTALVGYVGVVVALTCLKSFYSIGLLWKPENQRTRELRLVPFGIIHDSSTTFGAAFDILGNVAFFVPVGLLLMNITRRLWLTVGLAAAASVLIEVTQYIFLLGRSDVTDVLCNTAGALVGAVVSWLFLRGSSTLARRWAAVVTAVTLATVVVFAVLVLLGPALGDPAEVAG
ncbi:VanZ family protein [Corynebacterium nuruki]|uniref:VanZ family protein n=1 Tax=Corynebacterium nuruki TaxID=1032851 RepID=UPI00235354A8